jgi:hypothetical protein
VAPLLRRHRKPLEAAAACEERDGEEDEAEADQDRPEVLGLGQRGARRFGFAGVDGSVDEF